MGKSEGESVSSPSPKIWYFMGSWNISAFIICVLTWLILNPQSFIEMYLCITLTFQRHQSG